MQIRIRDLVNLDPGSGIEKFWSGINISDPQHWNKYKSSIGIRLRTGGATKATEFGKITSLLFIIILLYFTAADSGKPWWEVQGAEGSTSS